ncbi:unnamed protein product [Calypogeia fissa]
MREGTIPRKEAVLRITTPQMFHIDDPVLIHRKMKNHIFRTVYVYTVHRRPIWEKHTVSVIAGRRQESRSNCAVVFCDRATGKFPGDARGQNLGREPIAVRTR